MAIHEEQNFNASDACYHDAFGSSVDINDEPLLLVIHTMSIVANLMQGVRMFLYDPAIALPSR